MSFDHLSYQEQTALLRPGIGLLPSGTQKQEAKSVIIPLAPEQVPDEHLRGAFTLHRGFGLHGEDEPVVTCPSHDAEVTGTAR